MISAVTSPLQVCSAALSRKAASRPSRSARAASLASRTANRSAGSEEVELAEPGEELGVVAGLVSRQVGQRVVEQLLAHVGELVDQLGWAALLRMRGLEHRSGLLKAAQRGIKRVVMKSEAGNGLDALPKLVAVRWPAGQVAEDQQIDIRRSPVLPRYCWTYRARERWGISGKPQRALGRHRSQ
jgi:hypothetical protein